jgi:DNA-directed RNA polymerase specialized sigma24 family protein
MPSPHHTDSPHHAPRTTDTSHVRRSALTAFYTANQRRLSAAVHARARWADDAIVDDACAYAWLQLVRRTDVTLDRRGLSWLKLVATQEAWRQIRPTNDRPVGLFIAEPGHEDEFFEPASLHGDPLVRVLDQETQHERLARFAQLKPRERRDLLLQAAGYSYTEIATLTDSTYTAVNRRLTEGRRRLLAD